MSRFAMRQLTPAMFGMPTVPLLTQSDAAGAGAPSRTG